MSLEGKTIGSESAPYIKEMEGVSCARLKWEIISIVICALIGVIIATLGMLDQFGPVGSGSFITSEVIGGILISFAISGSIWTIRKYKKTEDLKDSSVHSAEKPVEVTRTFSFEAEKSSDKPDVNSDQNDLQKTITVETSVVTSPPPKPRPPVKKQQPPTSKVPPKKRLPLGKPQPHYSSRNPPPPPQHTSSQSVTVGSNDSPSFPETLTTEHYNEIPKEDLDSYSETISQLNSGEYTRIAVSSQDTVSSIKEEKSFVLILKQENIYYASRIGVMASILDKEDLIYGFKFIEAIDDSDRKSTREMLLDQSWLDNRDH
jgi:hypothetical protein